LHPDFLTRRFVRLVRDSGLPPVRLHDLRHGASSLAHGAGADLKTVQEQLGHTSIALTADTYTSVLHEQHVKAAAATARLVPAGPDIVYTHPDTTVTVIAGERRAGGSSSKRHRYSGVRAETGRMSRRGRG
jgi:integrase-like protein